MKRALLAYTLTALLSSFLMLSGPSESSAKTMICSKFDFFNAQTLENFKKTGEVLDWVPETPFPDDLTKIVIAIPKSEVGQKFGCVEQADRLVPGVKNAIFDSVSAVGAIPEYYDEIIIGKYSKTNLFGPVTTSIRYIRGSSVIVQTIITRALEPTRSVNALERYYDLPLGYCDKKNSCGIKYGDP
jgi:hypothetical protein